MSETGFQMFSRAFGLGAELLYACMLTAFFRPFVARDRRRRKLPAIFSIYILFELLCGWAALPQGAFGLILAAMLLAGAGWIGLERPSAFLLTLLYFNARGSSGLMVQSLYFILERLLPPRLEPPEAVFLRAAVLVTLFLASHAVLMGLMLYALQRRMRRRRMALHWREVCCTGLVPAAGILFGQMISRLLVEVKDGVLLQLYERHPAFLALVPVLALLFYAGGWLAIALQQDMAALREEQAVHWAEERQTQAIRARIHEAERFYDQVRRMKHEMRGHLTNIRGLVRSGEYAGLEEYLSKIDGCTGDFELTLQTGNPVTDVIVNDIQRRSMELGIRFQADFHCPGAYDAFDMGIILQNLLQNAVEACERADESRRFITLAGKRRGRFFLIEVKNAFAGEVIFGPDGLPVTTKQEDAPMHGIGLSNVRREVEKYMGELELKTERQVFFATVLLQERSSL